MFLYILFDKKVENFLRINETFIFSRGDGSVGG